MSEILIHRGPAPADQFMIVTNAFMRGELPVPLKALPRVLLGYFLSLPSGWRINRDSIQASVAEGRDAVNEALKDLESKGYLRRTRRRGPRGTWVWTYAITDDPVARPLEKPQVAPCPETPEMVAPEMAEPETVNQAIRTEDLPKKTKTSPDAAAPEQPELGLQLPAQRPEPPGIGEPGDAPTLNQRATRLAQEHYERLGKMGNVPAFMKIIRKALEHGFADDAVDRACAWIAGRNWTLTEEKLANTLRGGPLRPQGSPNTKPPVRSGAHGRTGPELEW